VVIDRAAKTISGRFPVSGTDDSGEPEAITTGNFCPGGKENRPIGDAWRFTKP
jgi:hypothetical protein